MRTFLIVSIIFMLFSFDSFAQKIIKYYDKDWEEVFSHDKAVYSAEFIKEANIYKCTSFYAATNTVRGRSTFPDTLMTNPIGLQILYNKKGKTEDSIFYTDGKPTLLYHYYPNGKLAVHYYLPENKKETITEAYDEEGNKIKNFIVFKDAEFKGGQKGWEAYLKKNIAKELTVKDDKITLASVQLQFTVDENGSLIKVKILKSSGDREIDKDALRVISESPEWNPAITFNNPVKALRIQTITYDLSSRKKSK